MSEYIGLVGDDERLPVVADTPEECAEKMAEQYDLEYSATNLENWTPKHEHTYHIREERHWRFDTKVGGWNHVSIHEVNADEH